jgi:hypothetical protein
MVVRARARNMLTVLASVLSALMLAPACVSSKSTPPPFDGRAAGQVPATPPWALALAAPPMALQLVDAPGYNVTDLTAVLRDALSQTSGVVVVDQASLSKELQGCAEPPCSGSGGTVVDSYRNAGFMGHGTLTRLGARFLAVVTIHESMREVARAQSEHENARVALTTAGYAAGDALWRALTARGVATLTTPDDDAPAVAPAVAPEFPAAETP